MANPHHRSRNHRHEKTRWQNLLNRGLQVRCACHGHCGRHSAQCPIIITNATPWDLGHADHDHTKYVGPECVTCNRTAGGLARVGKLARPMIIMDEASRW